MERMKMERKLDLPDAINSSVSENYTQVPNDLLRNPEISCKAKTILSILLSNREGWVSHKTTLMKYMKEGEHAITEGLRELETHGYLLRIRIRMKENKRWVGSFWAYTNTAFNFNVAEQVKFLHEKRMECVIKRRFDPQPDFPHVGFPYVGFPHVENQGLIILTYNNTNNKNIKHFARQKNSEEKTIKTSSKKTVVKPQERNKKYLPLAILLSEIVQSHKNIRHSPGIIRDWSNEIRKLSEINAIEYDRILIALRWYKTRIGDKYIPEVESGHSLRTKFLRLEAAMERDDNAPAKVKKEKQEIDFNKEESIRSYALREAALNY